MKLAERQPVGFLYLPLGWVGDEVLGDHLGGVGVERVLVPPEGDDVPAVLGGARDELREVVAGIVRRALAYEQAIAYGGIGLGDGLFEVRCKRGLAHQRGGRLERAQPGGAPRSERLDARAGVGVSDAASGVGVDGPLE